MAKKETAEQKLLRMIEDSGGSGSAGPADAQASAAVSVSPTAQSVAAAVKGTGVSVPPVFSILGDKMQGFSGLFTGKSFGLKQMNIMLIFLIVVASLGLGIFYKSESAIMNKAIDFSDGIKPVDIAGGVEILPQYKPLASFLEVVLQRNIFRPYEKKDPALADVDPGSEKIATKVKAFKLVGISWLDTPDSASIMVEDPNGVTVFLKENDKMSDVFVKKIFADRVIFSYEDQEMEVRL